MFDKKFFVHVLLFWVLYHEKRPEDFLSPVWIVRECVVWLARICGLDLELGGCLKLFRILELRRDGVELVVGFVSGTCCWNTCEIDACKVGMTRR